MRVLVTSTPGTGHVHPLLPLVDALRRAGHDVLWATAQDGANEVRQHGFDVAIAGMNLEERLASLKPELPRILSRPPRTRRGHLFAGFFARGAAPKMALDLGPVFDDFQPDVALHEIAELGAAPHCVARNIPHATVAFGSALADYAIPLVADALVPVWGSLGLNPPSINDIAGDVYFHPFSVAMGHRPVLDQVVEMRPTDVAHTAIDEPEWIASFGRDRPAVYVTSGTTPVVATLAPWRPTFEALGRFDVDVLATIGPRFPVEELGPLPANVRVERFVPQGLVLPRCSVVVSHGGAGTILAAAREGLPQLAIPTWADQWENSDAIARAGSAIVLEEGERDRDAIHAAVDRLLHGTTHRNAAHLLAQEIAAMPSPNDHVATIEHLVAP
jgi:UDP:flavonoid glycosyltransferase YjiC (YdhE family)